MDLINIGNYEIPNHNAEDNLEELDILSMHEDYDSSIMTIQNSRLIVKISNVIFIHVEMKLIKYLNYFLRKEIY